jgi:hypothetical protein
MLAEAITPELATVHRLNPFDFEFADVGGYLLCSRWVGRAAIGQIRKAHHAVAMDIVDTEALPVFHYAVEVAYYPDNLGHMMVDSRIQHRRCCLVVLTRSTMRAALWHGGFAK